VSRVPLVDLAWQHREVADEVAAGFARVLADTSFVLGAAVREFEEAYASFLGVRHCIGVANGTDALEVALRALGVGAGDEVIVPANRVSASARAGARAGAVPVLADVDEADLLLDPAEVERRRTPRTRAVMPVHLYGQCARMEAIGEVARALGLAVVEDAAQAHGASRGGRPAGGMGAIAGTSFFPGKNLGAYGDAGAVLTADDALAAKARALRSYGSEVKYHHPEMGFNSRLDSMQAVVLSAKLRRLADWNEDRRRAARRYDEMLEALPSLGRIVTHPEGAHVHHLYVVRVPERDRVLARLHEAGIGAGVHYPVPIHLQGAFRHLGLGPGSFPRAERAAREVLSLPIYPGILPEQQGRVVDALRAALEGR
jgi:dTDP-4-amino-4,6-dideoxygalactose transaminase